MREANDPRNAVGCGVLLVMLIYALVHQVIQLIRENWETIIDLLIQISFGILLMVAIAGVIWLFDWYFRKGRHLLAEIYEDWELKGRLKRKQKAYLKRKKEWDCSAVGQNHKELIQQKKLAARRMDEVKNLLRRARSQRGKYVQYVSERPELGGNEIQEAQRQITQIDQKISVGEDALSKYRIALDKIELQEIIISDLKSDFLTNSWALDQYLESDRFLVDLNERIVEIKGNLEEIQVSVEFGKEDKVDLKRGLNYGGNEIDTEGPLDLNDRPQRLRRDEPKKEDKEWWE